MHIVRLCRPTSLANHDVIDHMVPSSLVPRPLPCFVRKWVWYIRSEFLVVLSQVVGKTGNPIRLLGLKMSCDINQTLFHGGSGNETRCQVVPREKGMWSSGQLFQTC